MSVAIITLTGIVSCSKTELAPPNYANVAFVIEWPSTKTDEIPKSGSIYLYPQGGGAPLILSGVNGRSKSIVVSEGRYDLAIYNENIKNVQLRNQESLKDFEAYLPIKTRRDNRTTNIIDQADFLYLLPAKAYRQIEIINGEDKVFTLRPEAATQSFRFEVLMNTTIGFDQVSGVLSGVASRLNILSSKALASDISSIQIPLVLSTNSSGVLMASGVIETFGVDPENRTPGTNVLTMDLIPTVANDKLKTHYEEDLTAKFDQFNNISLDIKIVVDPPTPDKPDELKITIDVVPWIQEDGGNIDVSP